MLLALDTSTRWVTACVYDDERGLVLAERSGVGPMQHGELLAPTLDEVLSEAGLERPDVTAVVVGVGPGPYTGLRVGVVTARTLGFTLGVPVYGVCSLDALASEAVRGGLSEPFLVTTDARRRELFWAAYDAEAGRLDGPHVDRPADIDAAGRPVVGAGPELYPDVFDRAVPPRDPAASAVARLAVQDPARRCRPEPIYLRRPDAALPHAPKPVS